MQLRNIAIALLWPVMHVFAQPVKPFPLQIGDPVPEIIFTQMVNYHLPEARLSDFRGKLVILDFWGTWCTACLHGFPKLDSLQKIFADRLQVVLVNSRETGDDSLKATNFFRNWAKRTGQALSLPSAVHDTDAWNLFLPKLLPHYAWISPEGILIAETSPSSVNAENIQSLLSGKPVSFTMKRDQDIGRPLFSSTDIPPVGLLQYSIFIKGQYDGLPSGTRQRSTAGIVHSLALTNTPILTLYKTVMSKIYGSMPDRLIILEVTDSVKLLAPESSEDKAAWDRDNLYSIDLVVPVNKADQLYSFMLGELNKYSGYYGRMEKRNVECWVLRSMPGLKHTYTKEHGTENRLWDSDRPYLKNGAVKDIVSRFNHLDLLKLPVVDESGYAGRIDLSFDSAPVSIDIIQKGLYRSGLRLVKEKRNIMMFVISEQHGE